MTHSIIGVIWWWRWSHHPDDGHGVGLRNVDFIIYLTRLSAREDFEFCHHKNLQDIYWRDARLQYKTVRVGLSSKVVDLHCGGPRFEPRTGLPGAMIENVIIFSPSKMQLRFNCAATTLLVCTVPATNCFHIVIIFKTVAAQISPQHWKHMTITLQWIPPT